MKKGKKASAEIAGRTGDPAENTPPAPQRALGVQLQAVILRELAYRELAVRPGTQIPAPAPGEQIPSQMAFTGQVGLAPEGVAQLTLRLELRPSRELRPIEIDVTLSAQFRRPPEASPRAFLEFLSKSGGVILYPYFREIVSSVSARGAFGAILLNPTFLGPLIPPAEIDRLVAVEMAQSKAPGGGPI